MRNAKISTLCAILWLSWANLAQAVIKPTEWHRASIRGHKMYYAMQGSGPTLVLLHGGGDSGENSFARQLDEFAEHHHIVAPDQVGQGRTPDVSAALTYTGMMEDTVALLKHLKLKQVDVVGWSDGGILALMLAVRHPELIRRLVISGVNVAPDGLNPEDLEELRATQMAKPKTIDEKLAHLWLTSPTEAELSLTLLAKITQPVLGHFGRPRCDYAGTYIEDLSCTAGCGIMRAAGYGSCDLFRPLRMAESHHQRVSRTLLDAALIADDGVFAIMAKSRKFQRNGRKHSMRSAAVLIAACVCALGLSMSPRTEATEYRLNSAADAVVGEELTITTVFEDTLYDLARKYGVGTEELIRVNPGIDPWLPGAGKQVIIPARHLLPLGPRVGIVVNLPEHRLYYYPHAKRGAALQVITYPVGIGKMDWRTPLGLTHVSQKEKDPELDAAGIDSQRTCARGRSFAATCSSRTEQSAWPFCVAAGRGGWHVSDSRYE